MEDRKPREGEGEWEDEGRMKKEDEERRKEVETQVQRTQEKKSGGKPIMGTKIEHNAPTTRS